MAEAGAAPRALFLFPDEPPQPDEVVCSGRYQDWLGGAACPYSEGGRMPLGPDRPAAGGPSGGGPGQATISDVRPAAGPGDLPCVIASFGKLANWRGERELLFPPELGRLTLYKCKQMFLLVLVEDAR